MCVVSMIMDHYRDRWEPLIPPTNPWVPLKIVQPLPTITKEEVEEFRKLLERAREYDRKMGQPDCELDEKRLALKKIARELGVEISFL